jgi:hypothetical protein
MKRWFLRGAALGFSTVFFLLLAEFAVRALPFLPVNSMGTVMRPDAILDHSLRPHARGRMRSAEYDVAYRINAFGQRDDEPRPHALMILGDSFMEGYGVERGAILADRLEAMGIPTINAGVKSYSPLLEYLYLVHRGLAFAPDTVVLFFDLSDPANDEYYTRRLEAFGTPEARIRPRRLSLFDNWSPFAQWLEGHSALYAYLLHMGMKHFPATKEDIGYAGAALDMDPLFPGRDAIPDTAYFGRWKTSQEYLLAIRNLLEKHGVAFRLVTYPYGHQVAADAWAEGRKGHGFPPGVSSDRPFRFLETWCAENGIAVLSLDRAFTAHPDPGSLYFVEDGHWTAEGHRVAADAVAAWMKEGADTAPLH